MPDPVTILEPETNAMSPEQETEAKDAAMINQLKEEGPA